MGAAERVSETSSMERERLKAAAGSRVSLVGVAVGSRAMRAVASKESCLVCNAQSAVGKEPVPVTSTELHPKYNSFPPENFTPVYSECRVGICVCERAFASLCPPFAAERARQLLGKKGEVGWVE